MVDTKVLKSNIDKSINFIMPVERGGYFETRSVQREQDTLIIYLSSMSGCDRACRFCWLTQQGQTDMIEASPEDYVKNAKSVLDILAGGYGFEGVETIHFNFMARGDVLSNHYFTEQFPNIFTSLTKLAQRYVPKIKPKFKLSTIFPNDITFDHDYEFDVYDIRTWIVNNILNYASDNRHDVEFYYSLYSLRPEFRKRWIPKAIDPEWIGQAFSGRDPGLRLHHALIAGQNDTEEDVALIHDWLERHDLRVKLNIVRYNPYDAGSGTESSDEAIQTYLNQMKLSHRITDTQIVSRVGFDVHASCGTFFE